MSAGETIPDDPLGQIKTTATGLLLEGKGGSWGGGPEGLTHRHVTYMLPGESIGEGGTFYVVDLQYSTIGLQISMGQYSDLETVERYPEDPGVQMLHEFGLTPRRAKEEDTPLIMVSFFDIEQGQIKGVDEIHAIDTVASSTELSQLMKVITHPELGSLELSDEHDQKYNWTSLHSLERGTAATYDAFLRLAGDNPAAVQWANWNFRGIGRWPREEDTPTKSERTLPTILRWLSRQFRGRNV